MTFDSATADRTTALALFVLGLAMLIGGYTMERLEIRQIHPASIPGLVPMILGGAMMLCSTLLFLSAKGAHKAANQAAEIDALQASNQTQAEHASTKNLGFATLYSVIYALGLVGNLPFAIATAIYITVFYIHFTWKTGSQRRTQLLHMAGGIAFGVVGAYAIASLFQYGFLVRLP